MPVRERACLISAECSRHSRAFAEVTLIYREGHRSSLNRSAIYNRHAVCLKGAQEDTLCGTSCCFSACFWLHCYWPQSRPFHPTGELVLAMSLAITCWPSAYLKARSKASPT